MPTPNTRRRRKNHNNMNDIMKSPKPHSNSKPLRNDTEFITQKTHNIQMPGEPSLQIKAFKYETYSNAFAYSYEYVLLDDF